MAMARLESSLAASQIISELDSTYRWRKPDGSYAFSDLLDEPTGQHTRSVILSGDSILLWFPGLTEDINHIDALHSMAFHDADEAGRSVDILSDDKIVRSPKEFANDKEMEVKKVEVFMEEKGYPEEALDLYTQSSRVSILLHRDYKKWTEQRIIFGEGDELGHSPDILFSQFADKLQSSLFLGNVIYQNTNLKIEKGWPDITNVATIRVFILLNMMHQQFSDKETVENLTDHVFHWLVQAYGRDKKAEVARKLFRSIPRVHLPNLTEEYLVEYIASLDELTTNNRYREDPVLKSLRMLSIHLAPGG